MSFNNPLTRYSKISDDKYIQCYYLDDTNIFNYHNLNGPAIIIVNDKQITNFYYICGKHIGTDLSDDEFARLKAIRLKELTFE